jgi:amidophosphoribosyltransferase
MGGLFGVISRNDCVTDLFFGTDIIPIWVQPGRYGRMDRKWLQKIHTYIENTQFRTKFEKDLQDLSGNLGIGCISDTEPQPLTVCSHLGHYAISTVGRINNMDELLAKVRSDNRVHFLEMNNGKINPTEMVATIIDQFGSFKEGIQKAQEWIKGSCSMLVLTPNGIYAARDRFGRTPLIVGEKEGAYCVSFESCALPNLGYTFKYELGPGKIIFLSQDGIEKISPPGEEMRICAFLWVYYGYPSSTYEGMNVEVMRYRNGAAMARSDTQQADMIAGIPDSGIAHAIGYSNESRVPFGRPFIKYTPTWSRSFMPQDQSMRNLVARMKLIPIPELVKGKRILFCDDSIVRGTQIRETIELLYKCQATEVHMRSACPPLLYGCKYLNFSTSRSEMDLAARQAIRDLEGELPEKLDEYSDPSNKKYHCMVNCIGKKLNLTSLQYQAIHDMLDAIGLPEDKVCTYCWTGKE